MREKLLAHLGHNIVIVQYGKPGDGKPSDVCVECATCNAVIVSAEDYEEEVT